GGMDELRVLAGSGSDIFNVEHTSAEVPVKLFGNSGADTFRISPTARNLNAIVGRVTVSGGAGLDAVVVNDQANTANAQSALPSTTLPRPVPTTAQIDLSG